MIKIILNGCCGKMGKMITSLLDGDNEAMIAAGVDKYEKKEIKYPVVRDIKECKKADVVIDCSDKEALKELLNYCKKTRTAVVICTTGYTEEQKAMIQEASREIPVLQSENMSEGICILKGILKEAVRLSDLKETDIEIIEKHHRNKKDAPSGTALALKDVIRKEEKSSGLREKKKIGFSSVRGGNLTGEHSILFCMEDEVIELKHTAYSRKVFAKGAIKAAKFLAGKRAGLYDMNNINSPSVKE